MTNTVSAFFFILLVFGGSAIVCYLEVLKVRITGYFGESFVARKLSTLDAQGYKTINNLLLPSAGNTQTTQIDHVVVSTHGIFCIETKSYKGWIFGNASSQYWTQVIYRKKFKFFNPLRQNYAHVQAITQVLGSQRVRSPIVSLVAFPSADKIKVTGTSNVGQARDVIAVILTHKNNVYEANERDEIYNLLSQANIADKVQRKQHIRDVRALHT